MRYKISKPWWCGSVNEFHFCWKFGGRLTKNWQFVKKLSFLYEISKLTNTSELLTNRNDAYFENNPTNWHTGTYMKSESEKNVVFAYRVAQNSKVPFPLPIRVSFPCRHMQRRFDIIKKTDLYANRNVRKHSQKNLGTLEDL